jgi:hypothetical protein
MDHDKRRAAAEERRMRDEEERREVAAKIADALGETGERPRAQIVRIVALMGAEWANDVLRESREWAVNPTAVMNTTKSGKRRTFGGLFFAVARARSSGDVLSGTITRREFFRAFTDRPPKPRAVPSKPAPKTPIATMESPVEAPPDPYHVMHRTRDGKGSVGRLRSRKRRSPWWNMWRRGGAVVR